MADREHLKILKQGVEAWNRWREKNPAIVPILTSASMRGFDLSGINLKGAILTDVSFSYSNLSHCSLSSAFLVLTNFCYANLRGAVFKNAFLSNTIFGHTDLTDAVGLNSCRYSEPSVLDVQTIVISGGLPIKFLRGCGLPDILIEYLPSILSDPIQFYSCFISYSSKNQLFADSLYADLQDKGVRCWLASEDLKIGEKLWVGIDQSIGLHDKLLLVLSKHSVGSEWVEQEVETALARERREKRTILFPIRLDDSVMKIETGWPALIKNSRNIGDFRKWRSPEAYQKAFDRLLRDLKAGK